MQGDIRGHRFGLKMNTLAPPSARSCVALEAEFSSTQHQSPKEPKKGQTIDRVACDGCDGNDGLLRGGGSAEEVYRSRCTDQKWRKK